MIHHPFIRLCRLPSGLRSFTLVEMLVSMAVLSLILLVMARTTALVDIAWIRGSSSVDNYARARSVLDLAAQDLQHGVFRADLPAFSSLSANSTNATGQMALTNVLDSETNAFYTRRPGVASGGPVTVVRNLSLVAYYLNLNGTNAVLQRACYPVPMNTPSGGWANWLAFQSSLGSPLQQATFQDAAPGVLAFNMVFRLADGTTTNFYSGYQQGNPVIGVGVGLTVVDEQTMKLLNAGQVQTLNNALAHGYTGTNSIKADWDAVLNTPGFFVGYPKPLGTGIRTFERYVTCEPGF